MSDKRIEYIDIAKGIAIILMIVGHLYTPYGLGYVIYSFHMPLFFIISGYFFNSKQGLREEIAKKAQLYLKPFFVTLLLYLLISVTNTIYRGGNISKGLLSWIVSFLYGFPNPSVV